MGLKLPRMSLARVGSTPAHGTHTLDTNHSSHLWTAPFLTPACFLSKHHHDFHKNFCTYPTQWDDQEPLFFWWRRWRSNDSCGWHWRVLPWWRNTWFWSPWEISWERESDKDTAKQQNLFTLMCMSATAHMKTTRLDLAVMETPRDKKSRKRTPMYFMDPLAGVLRRLTPTLSLWWVLYVHNPQPNCTR